MSALSSRSRPPYELTSNVVYFHDWRYVNHGGYRWERGDGTAAGLFTLEEPGGHGYRHIDMPGGVRIATRRAQKSGPVISAEGDEILLMGGTLIHEEGRYRLWYECWPKEQIGAPGKGMGNHNFLRYAESEDGVTWRKPKLGLVERNGNRENNIVFGAQLTQGHGFHGGCVFRDPSAPPAERYKAFHLGQLSEAEFEEYRRKRPGEVDPFADARKPYALFGAVSPDGLSWRHMPETLVAQNSDTHNCCAYDAAEGKYVAYVRAHLLARRTIGRMETPDFRRFPLPELVFWPDAGMAPHDLWYANGKTMMPGTTEYHVMFPTRWSLPLDCFQFHMAASPDGRVWNLTPEGPVCEPGGVGSWDANIVWPGIGLAELPGGRTGLLYAGSPLPHKHPRRPPLGELGWAWWPRERLVALEAPGEGSFALWPLKVKGRRVRLNCRVRAAGHIRVEAVGPQREALPGRGFAECDAVTGDGCDLPVTWRGEADLGHAEGAPVTLRFRMRGAELYSVRFA